MTSEITLHGPGSKIHVQWSDHNCVPRAFVIEILEMRDKPRTLHIAIDGNSMFEIVSRDGGLLTQTYIGPLPVLTEDLSNDLLELENRLKVLRRKLDAR